MWNQDLYNRAWQFAADAHNGQTVPGAALPYIVHVGSVAMEIMAAIAVDPPERPDLALQCAVLHDTLEDTAVRYSDIAERFGPDVAAGVSALSKDPAIPDKGERMADSLRRIRTQPREIWMVKMADRITNLQPPPACWSPKKIAAYHREAQRIHQALRTAHRYLDQRLAEKITQYVQYA